MGPRVQDAKAVKSEYIDRESPSSVVGGVSVLFQDLFIEALSAVIDDVMSTAAAAAAASVAAMSRVDIRCRISSL